MTPDTTTALGDWLLERIAEDEAVALAVQGANDPLDWTPDRDWPPAVGLAGPVDGPSGYSSIVADPARVLAECGAKRRRVEWAAETAAMCPEDDWPDEGGMDLAPLSDVARWLLKIEALPYRHRPDWREEWAL